MFRLLFLTFYGKFRGTSEQVQHLHESPASMRIPLIILAVLSVVGGLINVPAALGGGASLASFLEPIFADSASVIEPFHLAHSTEYMLMAASGLAAIVMAFLAYNRYVKSQALPKSDLDARGSLERLSYNKFYVDEIYDGLIVKPLNKLSIFFYKVVDKIGIDGLVNGIGRGVAESGKGVRLLQSGNVGFYIFLMVLGVIALLLYGVYTI